MSNNGQNDNQQQPNIDGRNILSQLFSRLDNNNNNNLYSTLVYLYWYI